jgi:hypothetical protein
LCTIPSNTYRNKCSVENGVSVGWRHVTRHGLLAAAVRHWQPARLSPQRRSTVHALLAACPYVACEGVLKAFVPSIARSTPAVSYTTCAASPRRLSANSELPCLLAQQSAHSKTNAMKRLAV